MRNRFLTFLSLLILGLAAPIHAQTTAAQDSAHWRETKADLSIIKSERFSNSVASKRAQDRIRLRDSLLVYRTQVVATVAILANSSTVVQGGTLQLTASVKDASGTPVSVPVTWSVTSTAHGTISSGGLLTTTSAGDISVTATAQSVTATRTFTAILPPPAPIVVASVLIGGSGNDSLVKGATKQLTATPKDSAGSTLTTPVTWSTTSNTVGTVSSSGLLTGVGNGVVTVRAQSQTVIASKNITVWTPVSAPPVDTTTPPPLAIFSHPYSAPSNGAALAEFPRDTVSIYVPAPTRTINVVGTNLQAAYDTARTGDLLKIASGVKIYSPNFNNNSRASWVTIQGTDTTSVISQTTGGANSAVNINNGAHHIQFLGPLKITTNAPNSTTNAIVNSYHAQTTYAQLPHHIIFNGVIVDADTNEVRRCFWIDGQYMAIVNSQMRNCASRSGDAQGILNMNGGPYRYENNYIEGGHQCFMLGGGDPSIPNDIPSDVVFRYNTCYKPLRWKGAYPYPGPQRQVKTAIETKNARRVLYEYNKLINVWADAQNGYCWLLKSTNQDGTAPWSQSVDITARYNTCQNVENGVNLAAHPQGGVAMTRVSFYDNTFVNLSSAGGQGICLQMLDDLIDNVVLHNTCSNATNQAISFDGASGIRSVIRANIFPTGAYGVHGSGSGVGTVSIQLWVTNKGGIFSENLITGCNTSQYPAGTYCTATNPLQVSADGKPIGNDVTKTVTYP
jgi:hypothetical protein